MNTNYQCKYNNEKKKKTIIREYDNNHTPPQTADALPLSIRELQAISGQCPDASWDPVQPPRKVRVHTPDYG